MTQTLRSQNYHKNKTNNSEIFKIMFREKKQFSELLKQNCNNSWDLRTILRVYEKKWHKLWDLRVITKTKTSNSEIFKIMFREKNNSQSYWNKIVITLRDQATDLKNRILTKVGYWIFL